MMQARRDVGNHSSTEPRSDSAAIGRARTRAGEQRPLTLVRTCLATPNAELPEGTRTEHVACNYIVHLSLPILRSVCDH